VDCIHFCRPRTVAGDIGISCGYFSLTYSSGQVHDKLFSGGSQFFSYGNYDISSIHFDRDKKE